MKNAIICFFCFLICHGEPLQIVKGTKQQWSGGQRSSGHGTNYKIYLLAKTSSKKMVIDQLWVNGRFFKVQAKKELGQDLVSEFSRNDTIFITAKYNQLYYKQDVTVQKPDEQDGEAIVGFLLKGKRRYLKFNGLKELEPIWYP